MRRNAIAALAATGHDRGDMEIESTATHVVLRVIVGSDVMELDMTPGQAADEAASLMFAIVRIVGPDQAMDLFSERFQAKLSEAMQQSAAGQA